MKKSKILKDQTKNCNWHRKKIVKQFSIIYIGKGESKLVTRKKKNNKEGSQKTGNIIAITSSELEDVIANAILKAERIKKENELMKKELEKVEQKKNLGLKYYSSSKWYIRWFLILCNRVKVFFNILFMPKKKISGNRATSALLKSYLSSMYTFAQFILLVFAVFSILYIILQYANPNIEAMAWYYNLILSILAFGAFILSQVYRIASVEVEKNDDMNFLFGLFAVGTSVMSIVISIVAILL